MKILSPAGNLESLKLAVYNGADEVYLGINDFNARNNIDGFNLDTLEEAVDFAHAFGVKVDLAINILFANDELQGALDTIVEAYNLGVDAFIIQDLGLAKLVSENYPEIELHASTQMGIHNLEGVQAIEKYGFKRVVLARETPLEEIKRIRESTNVEIEYFAQGALCVSFSGNCYLSSYLCNASGNRGKCKQLCRLPYILKKNGKTLKEGFLLSAKDFNLSTRLSELESVGVDVLKIEGRARRPFYVAMTTREYYNALYKGRANQNNLKLAFNRNYTPGYFDGNGKIISEYQNHIGINIGKIEKVIYGKKFNEVYFTSKVSLYPKSTFKIFENGKEQTTLTAYDLKEVARGKYKLTTTQRVSVGNTINLIVDAKLEEQVLFERKRRDIDLSLCAKTGKPIKAIVTIGERQIEVEGEVCEQAIKQPITEEMLNENFNKSEIFNVNLKCEIDSFFMPKQKLNEFRRKVFQKVYEEIIHDFKHNIKKTTVKTDYNVKKVEDFQIVENANEELVSKNIIYSPSEYNLEEVLFLKNICEKQNKKAFLDLPNFALKRDIEFLKGLVKDANISIVANNYYALTFDADMIIGGGLNVYNNLTAKEYDKPILIAEGDGANRVSFPYMTLRHCPMKSHLNADCSKCPYCDGYTYTMDNGKVLKLKRKKLSTCTFYLTD